MRIKQQINKNEPSETVYYNCMISNFYKVEIKSNIIWMKLKYLQG